MAEWFDGGCHCERVKFRVLGPIEEMVVCNCSICTMKGFLHCIVPPERFELLRGSEALADYRFNTGVAKHTFCRHCGIHPFYTPRSHPDKIDVNLRCVPGVDVSTLPERPFDGQNWEQTIDALRARL
ncbi:MAG TPA: GFA family protein [Polyangiaceae bacterium]|jgi:hypothetical protein|nr:GFA family protein [Polyangiaceae bacterium]